MPEPESRTRTPYQRDRDRIIHSNAFRRLKHKTQVFVATEGDHYRTRLTHTIEVSQIARAFARAFRIDEDLTEAIALVHDFGHTPFGHAGERALDRRTEEIGGFDHNAQALRVVTVLERRYAEFDGLNLSFATLEGLVKHNGPLVGPGSAGVPVPRPIRDYDERQPLGLASFASLEAQCAAISDDIAYNTHDLDDGLRAGLIAVEDLGTLSLAGEVAREVHEAYPRLDASRLAHEIMRRHITRMVEDVIATTLGRLAELGPRSVADIRAAPAACVAFSPAMLTAVEETRAFLFERVYRAPRVMSVMRDAERVVDDLFEALMHRDEALPGSVRESGFVDEAERMRWVSDYLSGMTDTFALARHRELFDDTPAIELAARS